MATKSAICPLPLASWQDWLWEWQTGGPPRPLSDDHIVPSATFHNDFGSIMCCFLLGRLPSPYGRKGEHLPRTCLFLKTEKVSQNNIETHQQLSKPRISLPTSNIFFASISIKSSHKPHLLEQFQVMTICCCKPLAPLMGPPLSRLPF